MLIIYFKLLKEIKVIGKIIKLRTSKTVMKRHINHIVSYAAETMCLANGGEEKLEVFEVKI